MTGGFTGWRKSSHSRALGQCAEVGHGPATIGVRDSKHDGGPVLAVPPATWTAFVAAIKNGAARPA